MHTHENYMHRCLQLAMLGTGNVSPNPQVGSVLVFDDRIIGEGYHQHYGQAHAEVNCIASVKDEHKELIEKSTLYVSLEPCSHHGNTPPCVDLILEKKIKKVVIGCKDFSAKVNGAGIAKLKENSVEVVENILEESCRDLNKRFFYFEENKQPYIILKWAESADGFIGKQHETVKISNPYSDRIVHQWRAEEDAIMVGYNTALTDNPSLNVRLATGRHPVRIVFDKNLSLPLSYHLLDNKQSTIVFNCETDKANERTEYIKIESENILQHILSSLYKKKIQSLIVEGGSKLLQKFIDANLWNEARVIRSTQFMYDGIKSPVLKNARQTGIQNVAGDTIYFHENNTLLA